MDEEYDVVVCGTGLQESIISGLLSTHGKKVLHIDKNNYYGGESASLNMTNLFSKFRGCGYDQRYGADREWNVDLIPKFVMSCGKLVKILLHTKVTKYLEWQVVQGTYVYQYQKGGFFSNEKFVHKVPATDQEALASPLMGAFEKIRCKNFFQYCSNWDPNNSDTWKGFDPDTKIMKDLYDYFSLCSDTIDFVGHAVALYRDDGYINKPIRQCMEKIRLYMYSISRYGTSPFIYPLYGLGGLPEGFSRLCAIHGGTYMLRTAPSRFIFDQHGKVNGIETEDGGTAKCKMVVCDPSYVIDSSKCNGKIKLKTVGKVIRCICLLNKPIPETNGSSSCQIIIPQKQLSRKSDIYITVVSATHGVAANGYYIANISTAVETEKPEDEIAPALGLLKGYVEKFVEISPIFAPEDQGQDDNIFVLPSLDPTSHFETASEAVLKVWTNITGETLDLSIKADVDQSEEM